MVLPRRPRALQLEQYTFSRFQSTCEKCCQWAHFQLHQFELELVGGSELDAPPTATSAPPGSTCLQWVDVDGTVRGFGVLRKSDVGYRAGPLFADDVTVAVDLLRALCARVPRGAGSGPVFVDVPEWSLGPLKGPSNLNGASASSESSASHGERVR